LRILHLASEYPPQPVYGLGLYVRELAEAQAELGHDVEVVTNSLGGREEETVRQGVLVRRVRFPPPPKAPATSAMVLHFDLQLVERRI
jgi:glycogen synthase